MPVKTSDRIVYPSRATAASALDALQRSLGYVPEGATVFLGRLEVYANAKGIDFAVIASHAANECNLFRDDRFKNKRDAFGIAVYGAGSPGASFDSYDDAAFYAVAEYCMKLGIPLTNDELGRAIEINPEKVRRVSNLVKRSDFPTVATISQMNTKFGDNDCWWMCDPNGPEAIISKARILFPNVPDQQTNGGTDVADLNMTKGLIPLPAHKENFINVAARDQSAACRGYDYLGYRPDTPKFLALHKSQCDADASNEGYFEAECCPALTDWEVIAATGEMKRFVRRGNAPSGWANGVVSAPYGDALAYLNRVNWDMNAVNRDGEAIEVTGWFPVPSENVYQDTPVSEKAWQNVAQWIASRAHDYGITYETFPLIPSEGNRSYITWHNEWTAGTGKKCPGPLIMNYTPTLIERARVIMKAAQTKGKAPDKVPTGPTYAEPKIPAFVDDDLKQGYPEDHTVNGLTYYGVLRTYEAIKAANRLQGPDVKGPKVGPRLNVREQFRGMYVVTKDKRNYVVTPYGTYIDAAALSPRVAVRKA